MVHYGFFFSNFIVFHRFVSIFIMTHTYIFLFMKYFIPKNIYRNVLKFQKGAINVRRYFYDDWTKTQTVVKKKGISLSVT